VVVAALLVAACGGPASSPGTPTPTASPLPQASFTGGTASARITQPATVTWNGGWCERGPADAWLALNVGSPNGAEYFGLVVGQSAYTPAAGRDAAGGGSFGGDEAVITWRHGGAAVNVASAALAVEVAKDLRLGTFSGHLPDGSEVRGTFSC
jgi:hypothetical protein